ncbi:MAG: response regulator [Eubacteriales bacterium]|nr:response regulator [Eubacteriales bacterium]
MFRLIVADDEKFVRQGIIRETDWKALNCEVVAEAVDGLDALEKIRKFKPDFAICDIRMPKLSGIEMLRILRNENNKIPVIFLTAYNEFDYAVSALKLYASDYILKPFDDGELEEAVKKLELKLAENEKEQGRSDKENNKQILGYEYLKPELDKYKGAYTREAIKYIIEHVNENGISIKLIADSIGISEGHLSHIFKKETGETLASYITKCKIDAAKQMLEDCRYKVYEVAELVGYKDISYFSSTFKKLTGMSPIEYQERTVQDKSTESYN